jgi:hypothetical protein
MIQEITAIVIGILISNYLQRKIDEYYRTGIQGSE